MNPAKRIEMTGANGGPVLVADLNESIRYTASTFKVFMKLFTLALS